MSTKTLLNISAIALIVWKRIPVLGFVLIAISTNTFAQAVLLKDINTTRETTINEYKELTNGGAQIYFVVSDNTLWKSTGTSSNGTVAVKTLKALSKLTMSGNTLYFIADDGVSGVELWKSNGTPAGTVLVKDINPGTTGSDPDQLTNVNGKLFFSAKNRANGRELWVSDGTSSGTTLVKDIQNLGVSSNPSYLTAIGSSLYFVAKDPVLGTELWKTDGTAAKTVVVKDLKTGSGISSFPQHLTNINGVLYFSAVDNTTGRELWKSNGFSYGTVRVKDIRAGTTGSAIENLINVNNTLFFTADNGVNGDELWKSNGTAVGTVLVKDMNPGRGGSNNTDLSAPHGMGNFTSLNGMLYFTASIGSNDFIYRSNGTPEGTIIVQSIATANIGTANSGIMYPDPAFAFLNGYVYYFNSVSGPDTGLPDGGAWYHLWKVANDGTSPQRVKTFYRMFDYPDQNSGYNQEMITYNDNLYTAGRLSAAAGFTLIRSDGTLAGTVTVKDVFVPTKGSNVKEMITAGDIVYMLEGLGASKSLYRTDGSSPGTYLLKSNVTDIAKAGNALFLVVADAGGYQLWKSGGTIATTVQIKALNGLPQEFIDVDGKLFFHTGLGRLWRSDGTTVGTTQVASLSQITKLYPSDGRVFIVSDRAAAGLDLLKYEGGVLSFVKNIRSAGSIAVPEVYPYATLNHVFYFVANDGWTGNELWRSNGTDAGTYRLVDLDYNDYTTGNVEPGIGALQVFNNRLYIGADRPGYSGLFYSEGTDYLVYVAQGRITQMAANSSELFFWFDEGDGDFSFRASDGNYADGYVSTWIPGGPQHVDYVIINETLFFAGEHSPALTRYDTGDQCGAWFMTGVTGAYPLEALGTSLIFIGAMPATGAEPYVFRNATSVYPCRAPAVAAAQADIATEVSPNEIVSSYPNPFLSEFTLNIEGAEDEICEVQIFSLTGSAIEKRSDIKTNTDYTMGQAWSPGMYVVKVIRASGITSQKLAKK